MKRLFTCIFLVVMIACSVECPAVGDGKKECLAGPWVLAENIQKSSPRQLADEFFVISEGLPISGFKQDYADSLSECLRKILTDSSLQFSENSFYETGLEPEVTVFTAKIIDQKIYFSISECGFALFLE